MEPMHQPVKTNQVFHNLTIDGTDIELTKFIEWIQDTWLKEHQTLLNISNLMWDNGNNVLRLETNCDTIEISEYLKSISENSHNMYIMYDFYTGEDEENYQDGVKWFYGGEEQHNARR